MWENNTKNQILTSLKNWLVYLAIFCLGLTSCTTADPFISERQIELQQALELCKNLEKLPSDSLNKYSNRALQLAQSKGSPQEITYANFYKGQYFANINNFDSASYYNQKVIDFTPTLSDTLNIYERSLILKGTILYKQAKFKEALEWYFSIYPTVEKSNSLNEKIRLMNNIGVCNQELFRYEEAIRWFKKILPYDLSKNAKVQTIVVYNISDCYINIQEVDSAKKYCNLAIELSNANNILIIQANSLNTLAKIYTAERKYNKAKELILAALEMHKEQNANYYVVADLIQLASLHLNLLDYQSSEKVAFEAIKIATEQELYGQLYSVYDILVDKYIALKEYKKAALFSQEMIYNFRENNQKASAASIAEMELQYETSKKEQKIKEQKFQLQQKNNIIIGSIIGIILLALIVLLLFRSYYLRQKQNLRLAILQEQNEATKAVLQAEEVERNRMSQILHDGVGQLLSGLHMNLQALHDRVDMKDNEQIYQNSMSLLQDAVQEIRNVSHQMQPHHIMNLGLEAALRSITEKIKNEQFDIDLQIDTAVQQLTKEKQLMLYRILQECIHNTIKHAQATSIDIKAQVKGNTLAIVYKDNGKGIMQGQDQAPKGIGLSNIHSRIRYLKGKYSIGPAEPHGFMLSIDLPIQ